MEEASQPRYRFELISAQHDVSRFDCKATILNDFLKKEALNETVRDLSRTFVLLDRMEPPESAVVGYFALRADSFYDNSKQHGSSAVPVVELTFLARNSRRRGQGIGSLLLIEAFRRTLKAAERIGIAGMHLAYTSEGKKLYDVYGFGAHPYAPDNLFLSISNIRALLKTPA